MLCAQNNAVEGPLFVPQNINTEDELVAWLRLTFPLFTNDDISKILLYYPGSNATDDPNAATYATLGYTGATAVNVSDLATGQQQRANVWIGTDALATCRADVFAEHLRRNNIRLSKLLDGGSIHRQRPELLQIPVLCTSRSPWF